MMTKDTFNSRPSLDNDIEQMIGKEQANIYNLDDYMEMLYDELPDKLRASALILQLARQPDNLEELYDKNTLLGALARTLREEWSKSSELATNITYIFFCFSTFSQFHSVISHFKVGALCMSIVESEIAKYEKWHSELKSKSDSLKKSASQNDKARSDLEKMRIKIVEQTRKQENLLRVSIYLLLNIAEDPNTEMKMHTKGIVSILVRCLQCRNPELLILVVSLLKRLSVYIENIMEMERTNIIEQLGQFIPCTHPDLLAISLRLLFNLSFRATLRSRMVKCGLLSKLVELLKHDKLEPIAICILYHISMTDDRTRGMFGYTEGISFVMKKVLTTEETNLDPQLMSLCVNLAANKTIAEKICDNNGLKLLMNRALKYKDALLMKMIRNLAVHDGPTKMLFVDYVADLAEEVLKANDEDYKLECLGTLALMTVNELDYAMFAEEFGLIVWIKDMLSSEGIEDDFLMEVINLTATLCADEPVCKQVYDAGIVALLVKILNQKQEDDEIVCQIVFLFYRLLYCQATRESVIRQSPAPAYLVDLMHDKNTRIQRFCNAALDILADFDQEWAKRIQMERFRWYNSQWLEMIENNEANAPTTGSIQSAADFMDDNRYVDEDDELHFDNGLIDPDDYIGHDIGDEFEDDVLDANIGSNYSMADMPEPLYRPPSTAPPYRPSTSRRTDVY